MSAALMTDSPAARSTSHTPLSPALVQPASRYAATLHRSLDEASAAWRLMETQGSCTAYQRFDWAAAVAARLAPGGRATPFVVEVRDAVGDRPVMLLPLAACRRFGHVALTGLDLGVCDYAAPVLAPDFQPTARDAEALWAAARAVLPRADLIHIERIPATVGPLPNPIALLPALKTMAMSASGLPIDGAPETLVKRICGSSARQKLGRLQRKLAREGEVRFVVADDVAQIDPLFTALLDQRRQRFRDLGRFDLLDRREVRDFYRAQAEAGLSGGAARLFGLQVDGAYIATALGLVHGGTFHGILLAMDNAWRPFGPGFCIVTEIMTWARSQGLDYFDFTVGDLPYKAEFGAQSRDLQELAQALSLRGAAALTASRMSTHAKAWLQSHPHVFDRLRQGRQALRRRLRRRQA